MLFQRSFISDCRYDEVKQMNDIRADSYISLEDAAKFLDVKPVTLRKWLRDNDKKIPAHKIGKQWKFKCSELDQWVNSGESAID